jgi:APA family basic amino acid/polyamine antiporter
MTQERTIGVFGATLVGIGGILGGGLMVLLGTAFNMAGPAAILAFALNGIVAGLTAMSVAEISSTFPQSGGAYNFAKKVLNVRAAFVVGWVTWFAYIVAAVLYALSFAAFTAIVVRGIYDGLGYEHPAFLDRRNFMLFLATGATVFYAVGLVRKSSGGGQWVNIAKVVVFVVLVGAGSIALVRQPLVDVGTELAPFFSGGLSGLVAAMGVMLIALFRQPLTDIPDELSPFFDGGVTGIVMAMGVTFISLQGFEMVSAIAGEVKDPRRSIPKAVFRSLGISFAVYMPIVFLMATAGVDDGAHIVQLARTSPETVGASAVSEWLGPAGYWIMVVLIAIATFSAIQANLLTASRIAFAMAHDHTLPSVMERKHPTRGTPIMAIYATTIAVVAIVFMISDLAAAGAASGLIFLLAFALTHVTAYLARKRRVVPIDGAYQTPAFPIVPIVGGVACAGLGVFQAIVVPDAGGVLLIWLALGVLLYFALFKGRSEVADAAAEALDPSLSALRGKSPLVLLPIANPKTARSMVEVANALAPSEYARVLLLAIVRAGDKAEPLARLADAQDAVKQALTASYSDGHAPEALITAASQPWKEIRRVADEHRCESLLVGLPKAHDAAFETSLETLVNDVDCDVALMRAPEEFRIGDAKRVLVPVAGKGDAGELRARLLGTLCRDMPRELVFLAVVPANASDDLLAETVKTVSHLSDMNIPTKPTVEVVRSDDIAAAILAEAARADLVVLGLRQSRQGRRMLGTINRAVAFESPCAVMLLARRPQGAVSDLANVIPWPRDAVGSRRRS